jgi:hypothetical protein
MPGGKVYADVTSLMRSWRVFNGNSAEFERLLTEAEAYPRALELWSTDNREGFEEFLDDVDRLLHNYVTAVFSLKDHSRNTARRLLAEDPNDDLAAQYQQRVTDLFAESPLARFVEGLRNMSTHHRLPVTYGWSHWSRDDGLEQRVVLNRDRLLESYDDWTAGAKRYLSESGERISLLDVTRDYSARVDDFHAWLRAAIFERHQPALRDFETRSAELAALWPAS